MDQASRRKKTKAGSMKSCKPHCPNPVRTIPIKRGLRPQYAKDHSLDPTRMKDWEIAQKAEAFMKPIERLAHEWGIKANELVPYGRQLAKLLDRKTDKDKPEKIQKAFDHVAKLKVNPKDKKSPTFGQRIADGKLPGGELKKEEDEKKETRR